MALATALAAVAVAGDEPFAASFDLPAGDGAVVSGRVSAEEGGALSVSLARRTALGSGFSASGVHRSVTLDGATTYRFDDVPAGEYELSVGRDGRRLIGTSILVARDTTLPDLIAPPPVRLAGKVSLGFDGDMVETWIDVVRDRTTVASMAPEPDGTFLTDAVPAGTYWLCARHGDRRGGEFRQTAEPVVATADNARHALRLDDPVALRLGIRSMRRHEFVEGTVSSPDLPSWVFGGRFRVAASKGDSAAPRMIGQLSSGHGLEWQAPAPHLAFLVQARKALPVHVDALGFVPRDVSLDATTSGDVVVVLDPRPGCYVAARVEAQMYAVHVRTPGGGAWRTLFVRDRRRHVSHESDGPLDRGFLSPGRYEWSVSTLQGPPTPPRAFEVGADHQTITLDVPLLGGERRRGRLQTVSGVPIGGVQLFVQRRDADGLLSLPCQTVATSADDGTFELTGLTGTGNAEHVLSLDEAGAHVVGTVGGAAPGQDKDVHVLTWRPR